MAKEKAKEVEVEEKDDDLLEASKTEDQQLQEFKADHFKGGFGEVDGGREYAPGLEFNRRQAQQAGGLLDRVGNRVQHHAMTAGHGGGSVDVGQNLLQNGFQVFHSTGCLIGELHDLFQRKLVSLFLNEADAPGNLCERGAKFVGYK